MAVRVFEIDAAAAVPVIELTVIEAPGGAAICEPRLLDALEDGVELGIADVEGVVVTAEEASSSNRNVKLSFTRTGAKWPLLASNGKPKMSAKNRAAVTLSRAGTMVWFRMMVMARLCRRHGQ